MPTQISNQARLTYRYDGETGSAASNVATAIIPDFLEAAKTSLESSYKANDEITYILSAVNNCCCGETVLTVTDNLGTFSSRFCDRDITPLTYIGPAVLFIDGLQSETLDVSEFPNRVVFTVPSLPAGSSAVIIYKVRVNEYADICPGSSIENTACFEYSCSGGKETQASHTLPVGSYADVSIVKSMNRDCSCEGITYKFVISNSGNTDAYNVVLTDEFNPAPEISSITVGGNLIPSTGYTYVNGVLTLPIGTGEAITVPAAKVEYGCDGCNIVPSQVEIVVNGTL